MDGEVVPLSRIVPVPDPVPDPETVIQDVLVDADQAHPAWVVTVSVPAPPAADGERLSGLTKKMHGAA